ncbi:DUF2953 domain-containing protein [Clostridium polynesiense]|uniref:DUF2953 domain-containing protein n=1 Tax=Clostridium polynesiense TaxID=1325933 RepID=UPI00058BB008|nr:DUF2953 domain-containing protein [Clostridium polynesiense]
MHIIIFTIFLLFFILFFPLKITLNVYYDKISGLEVFIFRHSINYTKIYNKLKKNNKTEASQDKKIEAASIMNLIKILDNNPFKPRLSLFFAADFSLEDSAHTALLYGFSNCLIPGFQRLINIFFSITNLKIHVNPVFKNRSFATFNIKSIIKVNLVKIIYMLIITYKIWR